VARNRQDQVRLRGRKEFVDLWRHAGPTYRLWLLLIGVGLLAFLPAGIALVMLMNGQSPGTFGGWALAIYGAGVALIVLGNLMRFREIRRYRERTGTLEFNPYLESDSIP
jgi:hypothetical protein